MLTEDPTAGESAPGVRTERRLTGLLAPSIEPRPRAAALAAAGAAP